jgi:hypothetical protein
VVVIPIGEKPGGASHASARANPAKGPSIEARLAAGEDPKEVLGGAKIPKPATPTRAEPEGGERPGPAAPVSEAEANAARKAAEAAREKK